MGFLLSSLVALAALYNTPICAATIIYGSIFTILSGIILEF